MTRKALGRGLSALIPEPPERKGPGESLYRCPIEKIAPAGSQPRQYFDDERLEALAASIRTQGVVQPLVVRPGPGGSYLLVAGERRWRAAQRAGLREVPVVIRTLSEAQAFEMALVENLQREDLNPLEEAEAYRRLIEEHQYTQEGLAERLGRDRSTVANSLRLLRLPQAVQQALVAGSISSGHARALLALERPAPINAALKQVLARQLSVRQTETLVRRRRAPAANGKATPAPSSNVRDLQERLVRALKAPVRLIASNKQKGRIEIQYHSLDELDRILEILLK